ncbi:hypothetical protein [Nostoc sp.]|uniref:hypothetical protein n=1 Tax=Nostoc sp. TaxID=1180 RepID=UPI002FFC0899
MRRFRDRLNNQHFHPLWVLLTTSGAIAQVSQPVCPFNVSALLGLIKVVVFKSDRYPLL